VTFLLFESGQLARPDQTGRASLLGGSATLTCELERRVYDQIKHADLLRRQIFIDGAWVGADTGKSFKVTDPADGSLIAEVPDLGKAETRRAIKAANAAWPAWAALTAKLHAAIYTAATLAGSGAWPRSWNTAWSASTKA